MVNVPGPDATTAVAAALQRMDLVRQIAAADISAQAAGHPDSGLSGLPDNIVALLACEQRERSSTTAVGSRHAVSSVAAGQSLPRQCVERAVKEPGLYESLSGVRQVQQTWRPQARKPAASVLEAGAAHETSAPCTLAVAQQQWRTLRRKQPTQSTPRQARCNADPNVHAERAQSSPRSSAAYTSPAEESADGGSSAASSSPEAKEGSDEQVPHPPTAEDAGTGGRDPEEPQAPAQAGLEMEEPLQQPDFSQDRTFSRQLRDHSRGPRYTLEMEEPLQQPEALCSRPRILSSCSTAFPPSSRPSSTSLLVDQQRRTSSGAACRESRDSPSKGSSARPSGLEEAAPAEHDERRHRSEAARQGRQGCGMGFALSGFCRLLLGSDAVEYDFGSLERLAHLGHGTFGKVSLVWCHSTKRCFALKAMSKGLVVKRRLQGAVRSEKLIMKRLDSPFLTKLAATFNRDQHLYILMEAVRGGDLHETYIREDLWGSAEHARFYTACVVSGLEYMHERHIIYRDLKMENVVIDARGYAKLCDFGLSRFLWPSIGSAYTICGTPEYKAPEIDKGGGYDCAVDWWAMGVLLYEMMIGVTPFLAESTAAIQERARAGIDEFIPEGHERPWVDLVRALCRPVPSQRLPLLKGGAGSLHGHAWFRQPALDWDSLRQCRTAAPYVPQLDGPRAVGHFNSKPGLAEDVPDSGLDAGWDDDYEDPMGPRFPDESEAA